MKCEICGGQLQSGDTHCTLCGQPVHHKREFDSVKKHWDAVRLELARYDSKREKTERSIRDTYRRKRSGRRWRGILLLVALVVCCFTVAKEPVMSAVTYMNGWWAMEQGDYDRAASWFRELDPDFLKTGEHLYTCETALLRAEYDRAVADYERGEYYSAMQTFENLGDFQDAAEYHGLCVQRILESVPEPMHLWSFDEDLSERSGIPSEPRGEATVKGVVDSRISRAAIFDGSGDYVTGGNGANMTGKWSMELLLCPTSGEDMAVLAKMDWKTGQAPYRVYISGGELVWELTTVTGECLSLRSGIQLLPGEKWYHVVLTKDEMSCELYVDGVWRDGVVLPDQVLQGEQILTIGDQTYRGEGVELSGFRGYIANAAIYENCLTLPQIELMYDQQEALCSQHWDTSYYALPEDAVRDNFLIYRSADYDRYEVLVFDIQEQRDDHYLTWNWERQCFDVEYAGQPVNISRYYLEGEEWILVESDMDALYVFYAELISSNLDVYEYAELILPRVLIGGRG